MFKMKTTQKLYGLLMFALMLVLGACYYDEPPEVAPIDIDKVSFSTHILPVFQSSCSTTNCHDGTTEPDLSSGVAYNALVGGGYVNTLLPEASILYRSVDFQSGVTAMPPGGKMSATNIEVIRLWIVKGAPNN